MQQNKLFAFNASQRTLLRQLVITDFKLRYQGSALGYVWSLLKPMMMFGVLYLVFTYIIPTGKDVPHFPAYLLLGIVIWTFFVEATTMGLGSIVGRGDLLRKVKISKVSVVLSSILSASVNLALNMIVVVIFMILAGAEVNYAQLIFLPLLFIELGLLAIGLSFFLSALYVRYRDISSVWEIILQVMFYATPIIYPLAFAADRSYIVAQIISLSPLAQIMQDARAILITPPSPAVLTTHQILPAPLSYLLPILVTVILALGGWLFFRARAKKFVEEL